jgi:hypothetical protein
MKGRSGNDGTEPDWRLTDQETYLSGVTLARREWTPNRPDWDHDHCSFCWAKFGRGADAELRQGWTTHDEYYWICDRCFDDFRGRFNWIVAEV